ncbi:G2/mitotic-specific cyclin [Agyrium rufum]|nr:G2/mitotic-specific cyclin [Agyrium rufum]
MPPARVGRPRVALNENDENGGSLRVTRAKAAALAGGAENAPELLLSKKTLQSQKSTIGLSSNNANGPNQRKRAALGDVSNVTKHDVGEAKQGKKGSITGRTTLVPKSTTHNAGVQKASRSNSTRSVLGAKDQNKKPAASELKRPASGSGVMAGAAAKKRHTGSTGSRLSVKEEMPAISENEPPQQLKAIPVEIQQSVKVEKTEVIRVEETQIELDTSTGSVQQQFDEGILDLDAEDLEDPLMVAEYVVEIFDYLRDLELTTMPNPNYMDHQEHIEWHTRGVLVDWLIEVHNRFHLLPETIFLAVNIIDRFLSTKVVQLDKLQLVGVTAMFIASKYEEVLSPHVTNFKDVTDEEFTEKQILNAERFILSSLNYDLSYPNPMNFLRRISKADNYDISSRTLGKYLLEISLLDHRFMKFQPSHIAASAMYLARLILERGPWDATIAHYAGYTEEQIQPVFKLMIDYLRRPTTHEAFFTKYSSKKFLKASLLTRQWAKRYCSLYLNSKDALSTKDVQSNTNARTKLQ